ncbi:MAG: hemolysin family protein [Patescibacteria group bacterium]|jgi:CBS domain containing-hemolysin-like protein
MITLFLVALLVFLVSALASLAETAFYSISYSKALTMAKAKRPGAKALVRIKDDISRVISAIVIIDNIADIVGSAAVGVLASRVFASWTLGIFFAAFTLVAIVAAKIIPKNIGESHAAVVAPFLAPGTLVVVRVFRPILWLIERVVAPFRSSKSAHGVSEDEIKIMAQMGHAEGSLEADESRMIRRVFRLNDITADDMMTPAVHVETIPGFTPLGEQRKKILDLRHSRVPILGEDGEQVVGVTLTRDLISAIARDEFQATPSDFLQEALRTRNDTPADDLLPLFQQREQHLAIVEDTEGRMVGVVTLEDVLEELVGEITDEKDVRPETIKRVSKTEILADEGTDIAKINHFFNTAIEFNGTLGDYLMEKFGRLPRVGDSLDESALTFVISSMSRTRPKHVSVRKRG